MPLIQINADLGKALGWLERIALALERAFPPIETIRPQKRGLESLSQMGETQSIPEDESWRQYGPRTNYPRELPIQPER